MRTSKFYLVCYINALGQHVYSQQLGGSGIHEPSQTHWAEFAVRCSNYKEARKLLEKITRFTPDRVWKIVKHEMENDIPSWAILPHNSQPKVYDDLLNIEEEERNLTSEDIHEIEVYIRNLEPTRDE